MYIFEQYLRCVKTVKTTINHIYIKNALKNRHVSRTGDPSKISITLYYCSLLLFNNDNTSEESSDHDDDDYVPPEIDGNEEIGDGNDM